MFELMVSSIQEEFVRYCYNVTVTTSSERKSVIGSGQEHKEEFDDVEMHEAAARQKAGMDVDMSEAPSAAAVPDREYKQETVRRDQPKVGRNDPCPCGSGKKYKHCCGKNA